MSEAALLDAIRAVPRDRAAREVYADWLEDRGDRRAACIRAHLAASLNPSHVLASRGIERGSTSGAARHPRQIRIVSSRVFTPRGQHRYAERATALMDSVDSRAANAAQTTTGGSVGAPAPTHSAFPRAHVFSENSFS
jgi:uncharacterized protein (TIGR02996 family)